MQNPGPSAGQKKPSSQPLLQDSSLVTQSPSQEQRFVIYPKKP